MTNENLSGEHRLQLFDCRMAAAVGRRSNPISTVGLPVAASTLDIDTAPTIPLQDTSIAAALPGTAPAIRGVIGWSLLPGQLVGAVLEFTVMKADPLAPGALHYQVRTVVGKWDEPMTGNGRLREGADGSGLAPLEIKVARDGTKMMNTRGSWDHCIVAVDNCTRPYLYAVQPAYALITFPGVNDMLMSQATSDDPTHASPDGNTGNWGVTYRITRGNHPAARRHSGRWHRDAHREPEHRQPPVRAPFSYAGTLRAGSGAGRVIPTLVWGTTRNSTGVVWLFRPQPGVPESQTFELMHAGGACMPVDIRLKGV